MSMTPRQAEVLAAARLLAVAAALKRNGRRDKLIAAKVAAQQSKPKGKRLSLREIGRPWALSRQRVHQIVVRMKGQTA